MGWIDVAQERGKWRAVVNAVMNLGFYKTLGISWLDENMLTLHE